jgi:hypothetical protein
MVQRETKVISSYKAPTFDTKSSTGAYKKTSPFDFKEQNRNTMSKGASATDNNKKQDPWGKVFKNEQHFKSMHIC